MTRKLHVNTTEQIVKAWESGEPISALCGFVRVLDESRHDADASLPVCKKCLRAAGPEVPSFKSTREMRAAVWGETYWFKLRKVTAWSFPEAA